MFLNSFSPLTKSGILLTLGLSIFGLADNLTLLVSDKVSVGQFHFSRSLSAIIIVFIFAYFSKKKLIIKNWLAIICRTFFNVISMILYFSVIPMMPIAEAGAGLFTSPIFVLVFSFLFFKENISIRQIFAFSLGIIGVYLIIGVNFKPTIYHFFPILAGATYAVGAIITNKYLQEEEPLSILFCFLFSIGLIGLLLSLFFTFYPVNSIIFDKAPFIYRPWQNQNLNFWIIMCFLGFLSSVAIYFIIMAYQISKPTYAAIYEYTYLISAGFFSWFFWGILPNFYGLIGIIAIIIAGIIIIMGNSSNNSKLTKFSDTV
ncbi:MAG: DMT family transporter [Paracoccaceae bacterium]